MAPHSPSPAAPVPGSTTPGALVPQDMLAPGVQRIATGGDWRQVSDIIGEAFADDPVNRYVFGPPRAILSGMRVLARTMYVSQGYSVLHGDDGATMWLPPGAAPPLTPTAQLALALGQMRHRRKGALARAMALGAQMAEHHPTAPHMYLFTIGTRASARGKGVGKALLAPVLKACDAAGLPVYLENSNPANTGIYRAHGFETLTTFQVGGDGPVMEPMWRAPRPS